MDVVKSETFAPILYVMTFETLEEAINISNGVNSLSSAIFTESMRNAETFISAMGSDCGIANVNVGTSGAGMAAHSAVKKKLEADGSQALDSGRLICRQTQTINYSIFCWRRELSSDNATSKNDRSGSGGSHRLYAP